VLLDPEDRSLLFESGKQLALLEAPEDHHASLFRHPESDTATAEGTGDRLNDCIPKPNLGRRERSQ
jgi:hypothetical protein